MFRPGPCVWAAVGTSFGSALLGRPALGAAEIALAALVITCLVAGGNALNDYFDLPFDRINAPYRPIPSGLIGRRTALMLSAGLFAAGLALSARFNLPAQAVVASDAVLLGIYARHSKRLGAFKNMLAAYLYASLFLFSACVAKAWSVVAVLIFAHAFFTSMFREIKRDIEDLFGDRRLEARTLPMLIGIPASKTLALACLLGAVPLAGWAYWLGRINAEMAYLVTLSCLALLRASQLERPCDSSRWYYLGQAIAAEGILIGFI